MNNKRATAAKRAMTAAGLTQMVITDPVSIFYLTGKLIDPGERLLALYLSENGEDRFIVNALFAFGEDIGVKKVYYSDVQDGAAVLSQCVKHDKPLGIDKDMPARFLLRLMELNAASAYSNASPCIDGVRARKDEEEAGLMRRASQLNDKAVEALRPHIKTGITETALRDILLSIYKDLGTDGPSFDPLIGFGPNAAVGHHLPDDTVLKDGDCVLIDIGCKTGMYCADMTRTFFKGYAPDRMREIYGIVKRAGDTARSLVKPGVPLREIDAAARTVIDSAGYGDYFTHRLGHFIGLVMHEAGDVSGTSDIVAAPGMVFSIEPGIYLPGEGGVRIEDLMLVTENGAETLNSVSRELTVL